MTLFQTRYLPEIPDYIAPDGSEIRVLASFTSGSLSHCTLIPKQTTVACKHHSVDEIWYFLQGQGEVWQKNGTDEEIVNVRPGQCLTIPVGTHFQLRNNDEEILCFIIATIPKWPGNAEAEEVQGLW